MEVPEDLVVSPPRQTADPQTMQVIRRLQVAIMPRRDPIPRLDFDGTLP